LQYLSLCIHHIPSKRGEAENMELDELEDIQLNEIEALKAIFMDDFKIVENKTAWKVSFVFFSYLMEYINHLLYPHILTSH
jgi:hypothetical protein